MGVCRKRRTALTDGVSMFARWLFAVFPREMLRGWRLVRADAFFWGSLACALALVGAMYDPAAATSTDTQAPAPLLLSLLATVARVVLFPIVLVIASLRFAASSEERASSWSDVLSTVMQRALPALGEWILAAGLSAAIAALAATGTGSVVSMVTTDEDVLALLIGVVRTAVFIACMVRFAFVPFLIALERHDELFALRGSRGAVSDAVFRFAWPLSVSNRLTASLRWRLLPYIVLGIYAPAAAGQVPDAWQAVASVVLHLVAFTALAVLFRYYAERRGALAPRPSSV